MQATFRIVEGRYLGDILDQPRALQETLNALRDEPGLFDRIVRIKKQPHARVVLTGMGSSLHALYPLLLTLTANGERAVDVETSELIHSMPSLLADDTVIVAVSQSGRSAEIVRLLELNSHRSTVVGVTNTPDSPLADQADLLILTHCGAEFSVSAKTYLGTLAALEVFGAAWCGNPFETRFAELQTGPALVAESLERWREHVHSLADEMHDVSQLFIVGRGRSLAACRTGALTTKESTRSSAEGMSSAAFRHGPMEMTGPNTMVLVLEGEDDVRELNIKLVHDIRERGGRAQLLGPSAEIAALRIPAVPQCLLPITEILPIQMLTLALAANKGIEAGNFAHATKVTTEE